MLFAFRHLQSPTGFIFYHGTKVPGKQKSEINSQIPETAILFVNNHETGWTEIMGFSKCTSRLIKAITTLVDFPAIYPA